MNSIYPRGWFAVVPSGVVTSTAITVHFFGRDIVLFSGESGAAYAVDPVCPHLGAHLGGPHAAFTRRPAPVTPPRLEPKPVRGEAIACPFHGWRFHGGTGECVEVPYSAKCPRASVRAYQTVEALGHMLVWFGDGHADWVPLDGGDMAAWSPLETTIYVTQADYREVLENTVDIAHFAAVHDASNARFLREPTVVLGLPHAFSSRIAFTSPGYGLGADARVDVEATFTVFGVGIFMAEVEVPEFGFRARNFFFVTPVDDKHCRIAVMSQVAHDVAERIPRIAEMFHFATMTDFERDAGIWASKTRLARPVLVPEDGPIREYRKWAKQFYE